MIVFNERDGFVSTANEKPPLPREELVWTRTTTAPRDGEEVLLAWICRSCPHVHLGSVRYSVTGGFGLTAIVASEVLAWSSFVGPLAGRVDLKAQV